MREHPGGVAHDIAEERLGFPVLEWLVRIQRVPHKECRLEPSALTAPTVRVGHDDEVVPPHATSPSTSTIIQHPGRGQIARCFCKCLLGLREN